MRFDVTIRWCCLGVALCTAGLDGSALADENATSRNPGAPPGDRKTEGNRSGESADGPRTLGTLSWHTDYAAAYAEARREKKLLFLFFRNDDRSAVADDYERDVLASPRLAGPLRRVVRAVVPLHETLANVRRHRETTVAMRSDDAEPSEPARLVDHGAFRHLHGRSGIVVVDLVDPDAPFYGKATSAHPFTPGKHYTVWATNAVLDLPRGTITQRTLLYALRTHPEAPASVRGEGSALRFLAQQANRHSRMLAEYEYVGHLQWGQRYAQITAEMGRGVSEVAAAGRGPTLVEAARSCVDAWRYSPPHWAMLTTPAALYGFDMVRSSSGNWYATGILALE